MKAVLADLTAASHVRHALHDASVAWPETNCHTDLLIEVLHALGREPEAGLGMTLAQDFEGDQFTFFKIPNGDLDSLFGLDLQELSIYRPLVDHIEEQVARGRLVMVEVDAHFLPDTRGVTYRTDHSKTTIAVNRFDRRRRASDTSTMPAISRWPARMSSRPSASAPYRRRSCRPIPSS